MIDNFKDIKELLNFVDDNTFFFIQIIKRRKENPEMKTGAAVINNYYLYKEEDLNKLRDKIINDCELHNARAYININRLDLQKVALGVNAKIADLLVQGDYKVIKNAYAMVCGSTTSEKNKRWIVDFDWINTDDHTEAEQLQFLKIYGTINELHKEVNANYSILATLKTKNGIHIITEPFNIKKFRDIHPEIEVHKASPTILYIK